MLTSKVGDLLSESAGIVNGARRSIFRTKDAVLDGDPVIVLTERWCLVNDTCTVLCSYVGVVQHAERLVLELYG